MMNIAEYGAKLLSELALAADKLSLGCLMDPLEAESKVTPIHADITRGRWWVCANIHPAMFALAHKQPLRHLAKVITTRQGTRYLVLAQQVGHWQHRAMLQVAGRQMKDFLVASFDAGFELSLGLTGGDESLLVQECRFVRPMLGEIDVNAADSSISAHQLRKEACLVATSLFAPEELTHEELQVPKQVCVSIVASCELVTAVTAQERFAQ